MSLLPRVNSAEWGAKSAATLRRRASLELSIGYGLILIVVWTPRPIQGPVYIAALVSILLATAVSFEGWNPMGFRIGGVLRSMWLIALVLVFAVGATFLAFKLNTLHMPPSPVMFVKRYWGYAIWAFFQEFLLLDFVLPRLLRLLPSRRSAVAAAAALFSLAHLPNPILTPATLMWGFAACLVFLRYRNLFTLALAHAVLGICVAVTVPNSVTHNMRVGLGYLLYRPPSHAQRSHIDQSVSTDACVIAEAPMRRS